MEEASLEDQQTTRVQDGSRSPANYPLAPTGLQAFLWEEVIGELALTALGLEFLLHFQRINSQTTNSQTTSSQRGSRIAVWETMASDRHGRRQRRLL
jgi:hypothetical protein